MNRRKIGDAGEELAWKFLEMRGYELLTRNFHTQLGEVDLICRDGDEIVFVEVKKRNSDLFGDAAEAVTQAKLEKIIAAAEEWLQQNDLENELFRIDVIAIDGQEIDHFESVGLEI